ncbi:MAG: epoxyqueuosine reductase [Clostridiales bacterium]|nr:epoxyqueuosine reductase [Clostridiales bacterium]
MLDSKTVKEYARELGADIVGIASMDRYEGAPIQMDPRHIMPKAKSMIVMGFRVMRGSLRGIEEGTFFSNYSAMGYGGLTYLYIPMTVMNLCKVIENEGYEAIPIGHQSDWRAIDGKGVPRENYSRPVEPGKPNPDVMIHLRISAFLAGLGEIGYSKMFLSPEFGPRQRIGVILTELELEPDPIYDGPELCNKCMACVTACPGNAISSTKTVKVELAGRTVEWGELDIDACDLAFRGGEMCEDGEEGHYMEGRNDIKPSHISPFYHKPRNLYNTGQAVCGARGCTRACMINLESRGVLKNKFHQPFRTKKPWTMDWSEVPPSSPKVKSSDPIDTSTPEKVNNKSTKLKEAD